MSDEVCEIVNIIPWSQELGDWCQHYIVRKPDGSEVEIRECECVFSPNNEMAGLTMINQFLYDNGVYCDVYSAIGERDDVAVHVSISWGDWKHDHGWCTELMRHLGYMKIGEVVTEEDGSDCYSAIHTYVKAV